jgi:predicted nucleic-acid-binding Zn-ribbon protein
MRKTKTCPKCDCKKLLNIAAVADAQGSGGGSYPASLAVRFEGHSFLGNVKNRPVGRLQAVTCSECGYTEHYVENPKEVEPDGKDITWLT